MANPVLGGMGVVLSGRKCGRGAHGPASGREEPFYLKYYIMGRRGPSLQRELTGVAVGRFATHWRDEAELPQSGNLGQLDC